MAERQTPETNTSLRHKAAGNLSFLLSVIRCKEPLHEDEEAHVRSIIDQLESQDADSGIGRIANERQRQIDIKGYTPEHDDEHINGEMAIAAACYAVGDDETYCEVKSIDGDGMIDVDGDAFPWPEHDTRNQPRIDRLTIAGALIAAEIDRELRRAKSSRSSPISGRP